MMLTTRTLLALIQQQMKLKERVTESHLTSRVYVKAFKRSVVGMAYRPTSKVTEPLKISWLFQG